jgi:hypothetical protein
MLYSSHLQGMERPVRSFRSFIRVTPQAPDKPLPPAPEKPPLLKNSFSSSITIIPSRSTGLSLWEPPSNWENDEDSQARSTPSLALRQYSPLLPEPPEDIAAMQADPHLWQQSNGSFQQTPLDPIHEKSAAGPVIPPRNPSRLSLLLSNPASTRKNSKDTLPSINSRYSSNTDDDGPSRACFDSADLSSTLDLACALSDMTMKQGALESPCLGSPRDQGIVWGGSHQRSDSVQHKDDLFLDLQGNKLTTFRKGSFSADDSPVSAEGPEMSDKTQALSFAQDYHNVLANKSFNEHDEPELPKTPSEDRSLAPQPLAWNRGSCTPPGEPQKPQLPQTTSPGRYKNIRKMSSWVNHRLRKDCQTDVGSRSISDPGVSSTLQLPASEVDQDPKHDTRIATFVQHGKDLLSRRILRKNPEPRKPMLISFPQPQQQFEATPQEPLSLTAPFEIATPILRLPGGFTVVRQSPLSTPRPQTASEVSSSPFSDLSWPDFPVSSPFRRDFSRRHSGQSATSHQQSNNPFNAIKHKLSSPMGSPLIPRSFSYSTISLASPQPQEGSPSPYSPPQPRRRSHNIGSPLTAPPSSNPYVIDQHTDEAVEGLPNKLNLFEKAKHARDAWKKQQKDAKNEKLKQSIKLVGPADARGVAGYIKFAVDGRQSGDSGIGDGKLPGQIVKQVS